MDVFNLFIIPETTTKGKIWCTSGYLIDPREFQGSNETAFGYMVSENVAVSLKRSDECLSWSEAKKYCYDTYNLQERGYLPCMDELSDLYDSIMSGIMKIDLKTSGLYESCNYRNKREYGADYNNDCWGRVWSSEPEPSEPLTHISGISDIGGGSISLYPVGGLHYAIPFFRI